METPPSKKPIYFWDEGRRFLDVWAMDGRPFWADRTINRVNGIKWLLTYGACAYLVFAQDWGAGEHVFVLPQQWAKRQRDRFWAIDAEADAAMIVRLEAEVLALTGSGLDAVLNPMKLVNLERDLIKLRAELATLDPSSAEAAALNKTIEDKEKSSNFEKRSVMKGWLRALFRGQAYLSILISALVSYDAVPFAPHLDIGVRVVGFWSWWLFTIPSLRSIKPLSPQEKGALNWAFLAVLFVSLAAPVATKDPALIWWADAAAVGLCYAYFYTIGVNAGAAPADDSSDEEKSGVEKALKFALRAIDFGSGVERGQRSAEKTAIERQLEETIAARAKATVSAANKTDDNNKN